MTAAEIIGQVLAAGGQITADGPDLVLTAPRPLSADMLDRIKTHKPDIVKALGQPAAIEAARSRFTIAIAPR